MKFTGKLVQETEVLNTQAVRQGSAEAGFEPSSQGEEENFFQGSKQG